MRLRWGAKRPQTAVLRPASQPSYLVSGYRERRQKSQRVVTMKLRGSPYTAEL